MPTIVRTWFITDKNGDEVEITSSEVLQDVISQMTPEERELWEQQYRFASVKNKIKRMPAYVGTLRDLA